MHVPYSNSANKEVNFEEERIQNTQSPDCMKNVPCVLPCSERTDKTLFTCCKVTVKRYMFLYHVIVIVLLETIISLHEWGRRGFSTFNIFFTQKHKRIFNKYYFMACLSVQAYFSKRLLTKATLAIH